MQNNCMACDGNERLDGLPPRERVLSTADWRVAHAFDSALPGWLVVLPRRHVTALHELTAEEAAPLGALLRDLSAALVEVTGCQKAYLAFFAEKDGFSHLHIHVVPRMSDFGHDVTGPRVFDFLKQERSEWVSEAEQDRIATLVGAAVERQAAD